jgi:hypothetical protein
MRSLHEVCGGSWESSRLDQTMRQFHSGGDLRRIPE